MTEATFKNALRAAVEMAIMEVGIEALKQTSMFPLSRRKATVQLKEAA